MTECVSSCLTVLHGCVLCRHMSLFHMENYWIKGRLFKQVSSRENGLEKQGC